jgi:hypothetical protein
MLLYKQLHLTIAVVLSIVTLGLANELQIVSLRTCRLRYIAHQSIYSRKIKTNDSNALVYILNQIGVVLEIRTLTWRSNQILQKDGLRS